MLAKIVRQSQLAQFAVDHSKVSAAIATLGVLLTLVTVASAWQGQSPSPQLEIAQRNLSEGKFNKVLEGLRPLLATNPTNPQILMVIGVAEDGLGFYTGANKHFREALASIPNCAPCWVNLGVNYSHLQQASKAVGAFLRAIRLDPKLPNAYFNLGQTYYDQGQLSDAMPALERARELAPQDFGIAAKLAQCYFGLEDSSALDRLLKDLDTSCRGNADCQLQLAILLESVGEPEAAKQKLELLRESTSGSPEVLYQEALLYYRQNDFGRAVKIVGEISNAGTLQPSIEELLGSIAARHGNYGEAIAHFREAVKLRSDERNLFNLAYTLYINAQFEEARQILIALIREFPRSSRAHLSLGAVYQELGRYPDSIIAYKKVLSLQPNSAIAYLFLGDVQMLSSDYGLALKSFRKAAGLAPHMAEVQYYLGMALMQSGNSSDTNEALSYFRMALNQDPSLVAAQIQLAKALLRQGEQKEALKTLEKAVSADPESAQARYLLAQCYRREGQYEQAESQLQKFKELKRKTDDSEVRLQRNLLSTEVGAPKEVR